MAKLVSLAGPPLSSGRADLGGVVGGGAARRAELTGLLRSRNGWFAFESALRVFPAGPTDHGVDLATWNAPATWRDAYGATLGAGLVIFAEDLFGGGFALDGERVVQIDPETGEIEPMAASIEGWAAAILDDMEVLTGYPVAAEWQRAHGALAAGHRLVPIRPFVLGGEFVVANLRACDAIAAMRRYGAIAKQLAGHADYSRIEVAVPPVPGSQLDDRA